MIFNSFFFQDKRYHIVEELCKNEQEYVEALSVLKDVSPGSSCVTPRLSFRSPYVLPWL